MLTVAINEMNLLNTTLRGFRRFQGVPEGLRAFQELYEMSQGFSGGLGDLRSVSKGPQGGFRRYQERSSEFQEQYRRFQGSFRVYQRRFRESQERFRGSQEYYRISFVVIVHEPAVLPTFRILFCSAFRLDEALRWVASGF